LSRYNYLRAEAQGELYLFTIQHDDTSGPNRN
jgi:hypothetical protein